MKLRNSMKHKKIKLIVTQPMPLQEIIFGSSPVGIEPTISIYKRKIKQSNNDK